MMNSIENTLTLDSARASLDWTVSHRPMFTANAELIQTHRVVVRDDTQAHLGVVGARTKPLQNSELLDRFAPLLDSGKLQLVSAQSMHKGRHVWAQARVIGSELAVRGNDTVEAFLTLVNSHDGSLSVRTGFVTQRMICSNQLGALDCGQMARIRHTSNMHYNLDSAMSVIQGKRDQLQQSVQAYKFLAERRCDDKLLNRYIREVMTEGAGDDDSITVRNVDGIAELFTTGVGSDMSRGTMWGAFNAVTEHVTHKAGRSQDGRNHSRLFGQNGTRLNRALSVALGMADKAPAAQTARTTVIDTVGTEVTDSFLLS